MQKVGVFFYDFFSRVLSDSDFPFLFSFFFSLPPPIKFIQKYTSIKYMSRVFTVFKKGGRI